MTYSLFPDFKVYNLMFYVVWERLIAVLKAPSRSWFTVQATEPYSYFILYLKALYIDYLLKNR